MAKIRKAGDRYLFNCPGCGEVHQFDSTWTFNGDLDKPTVSPSLLMRSGHYSSHFKPGDDCWCTYNEKHRDEPAAFKCFQCHSFIRDGRIEFLSDCTHGLAGQTVEIPDWRKEGE